MKNENNICEGEETGASRSNILVVKVSMSLKSMPFTKFINQLHKCKKSRINKIDFFGPFFAFRLVINYPLLSNLTILVLSILLYSTYGIRSLSCLPFFV